MFKTLGYMSKQNQTAQKKKKKSVNAQTAEELNEIAMEMRWSSGLMLPGCFPDGIWYFH